MSGLYDETWKTVELGDLPEARYRQKANGDWTNDHYHIVTSTSAAGLAFEKILDQQATIKEMQSIVMKERLRADEAEQRIADLTNDNASPMRVELEIANIDDRKKVIAILAENGYTVTVEHYKSEVFRSYPDNARIVVFIESEAGDEQ